MGAKAELLHDLCRSLDAVQLAGLQARHPGSSRSELEHLAARARLGDSLFEKANDARRAAT